MATETKQIIREKEAFRWEIMVNIDGHDTRVYVKATVNYETQSYKIHPVITMTHGWDEEVQEQFIAGIEDCKEECEERLSRYRGEIGSGAQGDLFAQGASD